jgi:uncharacterized DUF497 family protein
MAVEIGPTIVARHDVALAVQIEVGHAQSERVVPRGKVHHRLESAVAVTQQYAYRALLVDRRRHIAAASPLQGIVQNREQPQHIHRAIGYGRSAGGHGHDVGGDGPARHSGHRPRAAEIPGRYRRADRRTRSEGAAWRGQRGPVRPPGPAPSRPRRLGARSRCDGGSNAAHIAEHGLTPQEVKFALFDENTTFDVSDSSGRPIAFGSTGTGRFIAVVFDVLNLVDPLVIRPITAYDVPEPTE